MARSDLALGSYEAAALLGVHFTRPGRMADAGLIISRPLGSTRKDPSHRLAIYSEADCERDFAEYEERVRESGGKHYRRPRAWLHLREQALKRLAKVEERIEYADACSIAEAMEIMNLESTTQITRLLVKGELIGRHPWNPRCKAATVWIVSRRSVEERRKRIVAAEKAGIKPGIRKFVAKA